MLRFSKNFSFLFLTGVLTIATSGYSAQQEQVLISLEKVFVPKGFDSNDSVEIIVSGELPNTCYLRPHGEVKIVDNIAIVEIKATKITDEEVVCIMAIVPYMITVPLGQLREGSYDIFINPGTASAKNSSILVERPNSNSINNFTYANVTNVETLSTQRDILIAGFHPSSCMEIDRVEIFSNTNNDTYSVLPIIKQTQPICDRMIKPFTYTIHLPNAQKDQQLLHVRKIDGTALNYLVKAGG